MATNASERGRKGGHSTARALRGAAATAVSPEAILDIIERLGVVDLVVDRLRARLQEVDIDDLLDDVGDYMRRNPEVVVVALGTITVAAGVLVYLMRSEERETRGRGEDRQMEIVRHRERERETPSRPRMAATPAPSRRQSSSR